MKIEIRDKDALVAVSPAALSAYARTLGWRRDEPWQDVADVYVGDGLPEILVPITSAIGDFASAVAALIDTFSDVTGQDQLSVFRDVITADRDIIRVKAVDSVTMAVSRSMPAPTSCAVLETSFSQQHVHCTIRNRCTERARTKSPMTTCEASAWAKPNMEVSRLP